MTSDIRNHVHRTTREDFLWLSAPREFARMLAAQDSLIVWVVVALADDAEVLDFATLHGMSAEYSERHPGWVIQL